MGHVAELIQLNSRMAQFSRPTVSQLRIFQKSPSVIEEPVICGPGCRIDSVEFAAHFSRPTVGQFWT
ncbi:MAG: hypothetical protein DRR08_02835 [Candidatus Parabeggiatoa sp. nov. 2]|nr:MAG: hypothetical protein DRR08_02835 [Gammaproteobacteria bacterium]